VGESCRSLAAQYGQQTAASNLPTSLPGCTPMKPTGIWPKLTVSTQLSRLPALVYIRIQRSRADVACLDCYEARRNTDASGLLRQHCQHETCAGMLHRLHSGDRCI